LQDVARHEGDHRLIRIEWKGAEGEQGCFEGEGKRGGRNREGPAARASSGALSSAFSRRYNRGVRVRRILQPEIRILPGPRTIDDAYITFRYAQNLIAGNGLVYNAGEAVLGTTTPIYALLLAGIGLLAGGVDAPFPAIALAGNALADAVTCALLILLGRRLGHPRAGIAASLIWALTPTSVTFAIGGMETSLVVALMAGTLYLVSSGRLAVASLSAALAVLTRPDSLIFLGPLALERLRRTLPPGRWNRERIPLTTMEVAAAAAPLAVWMVYGTATYGNPIPHSILAKVSAYRLPPEAGLVRMLQHYGTPFFEELRLGPAWIAVGLILYPALCVLAARRLRSHAWLWPALLYPLAYFAVFSFVNPLIFRWYLAPPIPFYLLGIFLGVDLLSSDLRLPWPTFALAGFGLALTLNAWTLHPDHGPDRPAPRMAFIQLELLYERVAEDLRPVVGRQEVLAAGDVGALGYFSGARILDTVGLISPSALRYYPLPDSMYTINYAVPPSLILDHEPDFLVLLEVYGREGLLVDPEFARRYELERTYPTDLYGSRGMLVFRRR
jgi:hypothetical protein